ncbi:MAG: endonuclease/exonuclease/phosphatase family protein [Alphaproteobacteria bacterium]
MQNFLAHLYQMENLQPGIVLAWGLMMASSLTYAVVPTVLGMLLMVGGGWSLGWAWRVVVGYALLVPLLVLGGLAVMGGMIPTVPPVRGENVSLRVAHLNALWYEHDELQTKVDFVAASDADVVSVVEVNPELRALLENLKEYPYRFDSQKVLKEFHLGMMVLSRWPVTYVASYGERMHLLKIARPANPFYVVQAHPQSPYLPHAMAQRNGELATLAAAPLPTDKPLLMVGDMNTVPWDGHLAPLRAKLVLHGSWAPTFPRWAPMTPIDLLLASREWPAPTLHRVRVGGTDHLGVVGDF